MQHIIEKRHFLLRGLLLTPAILIAAGGLLQASRTRFDFSGEVPIWSIVPVWVISVNGLLLSLPFVFVGLYGFWIVWQRTRSRFGFDLILFGIGFVGVLPTVFIQFLDRKGEETSFSYRMIFGDGTTIGLSLATTLIAAAVWAGLTWAFLNLFASGLVPQGSGKYDKRSNEPDAVGALIRESQSR